jgi:hypothetical protein
VKVLLLRLTALICAAITAAIGIFTLETVLWLLDKQQTTDQINRARGNYKDVPPYAFGALLVGIVGFIVLILAVSVTVSKIKSASAAERVVRNRRAAERARLEREARDRRNAGIQAREWNELSRKQAACSHANAAWEPYHTTGGGVYREKLRNVYRETNYHGKNLRCPTCDKILQSDLRYSETTEDDMVTGRYDKDHPENNYP